MADTTVGSREEVRVDVRNVARKLSLADLGPAESIYTDAWERVKG